MELNPLDHLFLYRYARLIMDSRQGIISSAGSDKQVLLSRLFSSLRPERCGNNTEKVSTARQDQEQDNHKVDHQQPPNFPAAVLD